MKFIFFCIFSYSPLFSFSDDDNYGTIYKTSKNIRFSIIKIPLGIIVFHFISFKKNGKFSFSLVKIIKFKDIQKYYNIDEVNEKINNFKNHLNTIDNNGIEHEIDFLKYKIDLLAIIKDKQMNKIILFSTFILAFIPLLLTFQGNKDIIYYFYSIILSIIFINILIWIISYLKVKNIIRSTFKDVKEKNGDLKSCAEAIYTDWVCISRESQIEVGYSKNIEKIFLFLVVLAFVFLIITVTLKDFNIVNIQPKKDSNTLVINIQDNKSEENLNTIETIINKLKDKNIKKIVIIYDKTDSNYNLLAESIIHYSILFRNDVSYIRNDNIIDKKKPLVVIFY